MMRFACLAAYSPTTAVTLIQDRQAGKRQSEDSGTKVTAVYLFDPSPSWHEHRRWAFSQKAESTYALQSPLRVDAVEKGRYQAER